MTLTGRSFFPSLIAAPFRTGLRAAFDFAIIGSLLAAAISWFWSAPPPTGTATLYVTPDPEKADGKIDED